jgi:hypothetical protein
MWISLYLNFRIGEQDLADAIGVLDGDRLALAELAGVVVQLPREIISGPRRSFPARSGH